LLVSSLAPQIVLTHVPRRSPAARYVPQLLVLEDRTLPSIYMVTTLADSGAGALRQAVLDANARNLVGAVRRHAGGRYRIGYLFQCGQPHPARDLVMKSHLVAARNVLQARRAGSPAGRNDEELKSSQPHR
jgi:hypothetical protein